MKLFRTSFWNTAVFVSPHKKAQADFDKGIALLEAGDISAAQRYLIRADKVNHASASYALAQINGSGWATPFNLSLAALYLRKAAALGHPRALTYLPQLEAAERGELALADLPALFSEREETLDMGLPAEAMILTCRAISGYCAQRSVMDATITVELTIAMQVHASAVQAFVARTGISPEKLSQTTGGKPAEAVVQTLDVIQDALAETEGEEGLGLFFRCSVLGYLISLSPLGKNAIPLLGLDSFFEAGAG